jgi:Zn finger protein HypA/HybF involved in hydrogenase expression
MKIKQIELNCKKCNHKWTPRSKEVRQCPKCKSAWWDK